MLTKTKSSCDKNFFVLGGLFYGTGNRSWLPSLTRIDRELVDSSVPLGEDEVELPVLTERAPLRVDDHVFLKQLSRNSSQKDAGSNPAARNLYFL